MNLTAFEQYVRDRFYADTSLPAVKWYVKDWEQEDRNSIIEQMLADHYGLSADTDPQEDLRII